jgi:hypothetical protein
VAQAFRDRAAIPEEALRPGRALPWGGGVSFRRATSARERPGRLSPDRAGAHTRGFEGGSMIAPPMLASNFTFSSLSDAV